VDFTLHYGVAYTASALASRSHQNHVQGDAVTQALTQMCGPVTMAALTTLLPGKLLRFLIKLLEEILVPELEYTEQEFKVGKNIFLIN